MGYKCTFGILQAGHYGVSQTRRRCILMAAAPGYCLPLYPEPLHTFTSTSLKVGIGENQFVNNNKWTESAPYRTITVTDCMSDLPPIRNGDQKETMDYEVEPETHFQRMMRANTQKSELRDHMCKKMNSLVEARMSLIPVTPGADWRDLPNIPYRLSCGGWAQKLQYTHHDVIQVI